MAVFQPFPRLYEQPSGTTQNYYGGLGRTPVTGTYAGNQNPGALSRTSVATPNTTMPLNQTPTPTPVTQHRQRRPIYDPITGHLDLGQGSQRYGTVGEYLEDPQSSIARVQGYDPRYYDAYQADTGDGGTETRYRVRQDIRDRLGDRIQVNQTGVVGRNPDGSIMEGQGFNEIIDPNALQWDDEFGWVMPRSNLSGGDPDDKARWDRIRAAAIVATLGGAAWAGGMIPGLSGAEGSFTAASMPGYAGEFGAATGTGATPATAMLEGYTGAASAAEGGIGVPTNSLANYGTMTTGLDGEGMAGAVARGGTEAAVGGPGTSSLARTVIRGGLGLAQTIGNRNNVNATADSIRRDAEAANPFGQYRPEFARRLVDAYRDPTAMMNLLQQTPGYQFTRQQGEQAIERQSNKHGYFRSPNMLYDLSKFNQDLASTTWDKEIQRIMTMAGVNINPDSQLNANNQANLLRGQGNASNWANIAAILGDDDMMSLGSDFYDWLSSFVG